MSRFKLVHMSSLFELCQNKAFLVGGFYVVIHSFLQEKHFDTHAGEICRRFRSERRSRAVHLSKVISAVTQRYVGDVASADAQLLCQHSPDSVIFLWPLGARATRASAAPYEKRTNNNRRRHVMTGKASAGKIRKAQVKCQRCLV